MDKNAIKKYAVWARRELIERVSQRAMIYGITAKDAGDPNAESVNGHLLSQAEKRQRQALIRNIKTKGYEQVMEEVAYTWFNRFAALRFMEVNGYLPSHIRVFTNDAGEFKPQILAETIHLELDGLDMNKVYELESTNRSEELFKYLLIVQCNALNNILPGMFQRIDDYTELLLPDYLLREGSVIEQMVTTIPEEDWTDQVQIIGWLYQYYNTEPKDKVFADLKKNIKITKDKIPAATQLFTPDWIVHYMVENSLGRLWLEGHPNDALKSEWKYYLDEAEQEPKVQAQLATIRKEYAALKPEEIRVIDPCMGSGHILCVLFDVLVRIYEDYGYTAREAAVKIVENNLWGLDIDERATQLSYFAVMMKARKYDRRFFSRKLQPHVYAIEESNGIDREHLDYLGGELSELECNIAQTQVITLLDVLKDAKEYGSLLSVHACDWALLRRYAQPRVDDDQFHMDTYASIAIAEQLQGLIDIGQALAQKYNVAVTNPPYMGASNMNFLLSEFIKKHYPDSKSDASTAFMECILEKCRTDGYMAMINIPVWMFLSSYEKLRNKIMKGNTYINMVHPGRGIFGSDFGATTFVIAKWHIPGYIGSYRRLFDEQVEVKTPEVREQQFMSGKGAYTARQDNFSKIPGAPVAYWLSQKWFSLFENSTKIAEVAKPRVGQNTGDNDRFLRLWHEIEFSKIGFDLSHEELPKTSYKWIPYSKGGAFRRWYGNYYYVINWSNNGKEIKDYAVIRNNGKHWSRYIQNLDYLCCKGVTWSDLSSAKFACRYLPEGFICDVKGSSAYPSGEVLLPYLAFLNSVITYEGLKVLAPTISFQTGDIGRLPFCIEPDNYILFQKLTQDLITISKRDWDSFETSWDFQRHPLVVDRLEYENQMSTSPNSLACRESVSLISRRYQIWENQCEQRFQNQRVDEEKLNRIFIDIYDLQDELTPKVEEKDVTVRKANLQRDIKSLISYAVGCMFGRYSLSQDGIAYAGGEWDDSKYSDSFPPDKDAILPICDDEYFEDDIVGRFVKFIEVVYGKEALEENLRFIADALGGKGASRDVIRSYFLNDFYKDHCATYSVTGSGKRPIYWLFDSGKKNGFKCLIYMHRYQPDTIARIRTDYVHEQQSRYRTAIADLEQRINGASTSERVKLSKQLATLQAQAEEIRVYEEKIHHLADQMIKIDLDDGVKHNYEIFKDVLAKIK